MPIAGSGGGRRRRSHARGTVGRRWIPVVAVAGVATMGLLVASCGGGSGSEGRANYPESALERCTAEVEAGVHKLQRYSPLGSQQAQFIAMENQVALSVGGTSTPIFSAIYDVYHRISSGALSATASSIARAASGDCRSVVVTPTTSTSSTQPPLRVTPTTGSNVVLPKVPGGSTSSSTETTSDQTNAKATLSPATVPPVVPECTAGLDPTQDGNVRPTLCANGDVNVNAWKELAKLAPNILRLGPRASAKAIIAAMCHPTSSTLPMRVSAEEIAARYYGWNVGSDSNITDFSYGSCPGG